MWHHPIARAGLREGLSENRHADLDAGFNCASLTYYSSLTVLAASCHRAIIGFAARSSSGSRVLFPRCFPAIINGEDPTRFGLGRSHRHHVISASPTRHL